MNERAALGFVQVTSLRATPPLSCCILLTGDDVKLVVTAIERVETIGTLGLEPHTHRLLLDVALHARRLWADRCVITPRKSVMELRRSRALLTQCLALSRQDRTALWLTMLVVIPRIELVPHLICASAKALFYWIIQLEPVAVCCRCLGICRGGGRHLRAE